MQGMRALATAILLTACGQVPDRAPSGDPVDATVVTHNVGGSAVLGGDAVDAVAQALADAVPDVVLLQECEPCDALLDRLPDGYRATAEPVSGVTVVYDALRWSTRGGEVIPLGQDDDGWGARVARRDRLEHLETGAVLDVYSTHFCVPIRSTSDACDAEQQVAYADRLLEDMASHLETAVIGGDFNVFDGFERSVAVQRLRDGGLSDACDLVDGSSDKVTFHGNSWAPPGRIDFIFTTADIAVLAAGVDTSVPPGAGSDHNPVSAALRMR